MELTHFIHLLEQRLQLPLPGQAAQLRMSSMKRIRELLTPRSMDDARQSSVLILLYPLADSIGLVLMLRPEYGGVHSGQISLPGGKREETDETLVSTALRESKEEIGVDPRQVQIIGQLTELYIPPSNFLVTPIVGYQATRPEFTADPKEVSKIIEIRIDDLLDNGNIQVKNIKLNQGITVTAPVFMINDNTIWGATAMILSEFKQILGELSRK
jgi:8-oxo-dGTP pyrophosphatase MutT (NUDIX family)